MAKVLSEQQMESINKVNTVVCTYFNIKEDDLYPKVQQRQRDMARGFILFLLHKRYEIPTSLLAKKYNRARRTVFFNVEQTNRFIKLYRDFNKNYKDLCKLLNIDYI